MKFSDYTPPEPREQPDAAQLAASAMDLSGATAELPGLTRRTRSVVLSRGDMLPVGKLRHTWKVGGERLGMFIDEPEEGSPLWIVTAECGDYYCGCGVGHLLGLYTSPEEAEKERALFADDVTERGYRRWECTEVKEVACDAPLEAHSEARYVDPPEHPGRIVQGFTEDGAFVAARVPRDEGPFCAVGAITQAMQEGGTRDESRASMRDVLHRLRVHLAHRFGR